MRPLRALACLVAAATLAPGAAAVNVPYLAGHVNDTAGMLAPADRDRIEAALVELEKTTGAQVAVLTVPSLDGEPIEELALKVAETWKLGRQGVDDGVLFLIARDERKMRLEVGYGLEPRLTDALTKRILDTLVRPHFKDGDFAGGIAAGVEAIAGAARGGDVVPAEASSGSAGLADVPARLAGLGIFTLVVGVFSFVALFARGCQSWFLYVFLMPFYAAFPLVLLGPAVGWLPVVVWVLAFPLLKLWLGKTAGGRGFLASHPALATFAASAGRSSGGWSSGGGSFSGGGGSFGGGGSSSSW